MALAVEDIEAEVAAMRQRGVRLLGTLARANRLAASSSCIHGRPRESSCNWFNVNLAISERPISVGY